MQMEEPNQSTHEGSDTQERENAQSQVENQVSSQSREEIIYSCFYYRTVESGMLGDFHLF